MAVLGGLAVVLAAVLLGFTMAGGRVGALLHLSEFITIGGASFGAIIVMSPKRVLRDVFRGILQVVKGSPYNKQTCSELLELLYALARLARRDGVLALENHTSDPENSPLFQKYPRIHGNHHAVEFLCNGLSMIGSGEVEPAKLTAALSEEIEVINREHHEAVSVMTKTADALPGFGIVAAVLGIVVTMGAIDGPASEIGHKVGTALVGTFLGILFSYGFFAPMAGRLELLGQIEQNFLRAISAAVVAFGEGSSPKEVVACARRVLGTDCRPGQAELREIFKGGEAA
jgi:chemotaxis protein MotA